MSLTGDFPFYIKLLFLFSFNITASYCQVTSPDKSLQHTLDSICTANKLPGISAAAVFADGTTWAGVSGYSDPVNKEALTPGTLFGIGSITKTFTTAVIMKMAEENILSPDDRINRWLPSFNNIDSSVTIRQLLSHTSGIYNYTNNAAFWDSTNADFCRKFSSKDIIGFVKEPVFDKGTSWQYSNTNFILLGMIIEAAAELSYSYMLHNYITLPYNLNNVFIEAEDTVAGVVADAWTDLNGNGKFQNFSGTCRNALYSGAWSAGGIMATASDIAKWIKHLYGGEVVNPEYLEQMTAFSALSGNFYGLGTTRYYAENREWWGHSGGITGFNSYAGYSKTSNISVSILINRDNTDIYSITRAFIKAVINFKPVNVEKIKTTPDFHLSQNYPNPFNPNTTIRYTLRDRAPVTLTVYDLLGREMATLVNTEQDAGNYEASLSSEIFETAAGGIYFYRLTAGSNVECRKMVLLK